ncbi:MAG: PAS domain S-box protein [Myxococcales bacterium]|nr:PAS domain S-box protein [Myxococcales bacterium]
MDEAGTIRQHLRLFDQLEDAVVVADHDYRVVFVNRVAEQLFGLTAEQAAHRRPEEIIQFSSGTFSYDDLYRTISEAGVWKADVQRTAALGDSWLEVTIKPFELATASFVGLLFTARDISPRKQIEETLRQTESRYNLLAENAQDVIWIRDMSFKTVWISPSVKNQLGYTVEEALELDAPTVLTPAALEVVVRLIAEGAAGIKTKQRAVLEHIRKDGQHIFVEADATLLFDKNGAPTGYLGVSRDVTERVRTEAKLRESRENYQVLADNTPDLIARIDPQFHFLYVNQTVAALFGKNREDFIGKSPAELGLPENFCRFWEEQVRQVFDTGEPHDVLHEMSAATGGANGTASYHWYLYPEIGPDGKVRSVLSSERDISKIKRIEEDKRKLELQLLQSQKMESIGRLAGGIAHDFNNILTGIGGYVDLILPKIKPNSTIRPGVLEIRRAVNRAAGLTEQLLAFSRKQIVEPKVIQLNTLIAQAVGMLQRIIGEDIRLTYRPDPALGLMKIDPHQVEQILVNLASNARDAMPRGGDLMIETQALAVDHNRSDGFDGLPPGRYAVLSVSDTGVGMDDTVKSQLFEPFFTTKEVGRGTGLGLSTIYGIIRQNKGAIQVQSEPGRGATFRIALPLMEPEYPLPAEEAPVEIPRGKETILLVEDEDMVRTVAHRVLADHGYTVVEANNGPAALQLFEQAPDRFALLLTDVVMPQMNGKELYDQAAGLKPGLKVLYMSGYFRDVISRHGILDEETKFLRKPFTSEMLVLKVREALDS